MSDEVNEYYQEWVAIESLTLSNFGGKTIDLKPYFLAIDIQEDLFMPVCSGNITILDVDNIYETFPIIGEETIKITYRDFYSSSTTRTFNIFGIENRERTTEKGSVYILNFCSEELLSNRNTIYSKSYKDKLVHEIFSDAFGRCSPSKGVNIQATMELQDYVVPNLYPFDVCAQMANRAISTENQTGSYLFYEDKNQFNFVSIEKLIQGGTTQYLIGNANIAASVGKYIFKNYKYHKPADNVTGKMSGAQGVEAKKLDLFNRKMEDESYNHFGSDYTKINRVNTPNPDLKTQSSAYKHTSTKGLSKLIIKHDEEYNPKSSKNKTLAKRYNVFSSYANGPKIWAELPFNSELTVGMMINIDIPKMTGNKESDVPENDIYIQGKYIITAMRQIIRPDHGETVVELAKDSYTQSHG